MERNKSIFYNALVSMSGMLITMILNLIVVRLIISNYGSDANGIISTVTQVISMITLVEAGMTLAINTSLYKPFADNNHFKIEEILAAANNIFRVVGILFFVLGLIFSFIYPRFIQTEVPLFVIISIFVMNVIPQALNYYFTTKYRILLQVAQKEYIINIITYGGSIISYLLNILVISSNGSILLLSFTSMIVSILRNISIYIPFRKLFSNIKFRSAQPDYSSTKGSSDILIQRITSTLYSSIPIIFISTFVSASMASVYAVYASVFGLIKQVSYVFVNSPQHAFGQVFSKDSKGVLPVFNSYQLLVIIVLTTLMSTGVILINPFIMIYTKGVSDIKYINNVLVILFALITWLEIIHIPSGIMLNISRNFRLSRNIQIIATTSMIIVGLLGGKFFGIYGILVGKLVCNCLLSSMEIWYSNKLVFRSNIKYYSKVLFVNFMIGVLLILIWRPITPNYVNNYLNFFVAGLFFVIKNGLLIVVVNYLIFRNQLTDILNRIIRVMKNLSNIVTRR